MRRPQEGQHDAADGNEEGGEGPEQPQGQDNQSDQRQGEDPIERHAAGLLGVSNGMDHEPDRQGPEHGQDEHPANRFAG